jgi:glycosyltransferase involved in cell wall biosynthesis
MKILYIHKYFKTPAEPGGTRSYWVSKKLIEHGHQVVVLTSSSSIESRLERKIIEGIEVVYFKVEYNQSMSILSRLWSYIMFMLYSTWFALRLKDINLVLATSTPLTVGFPALILKVFKGIPYVFEVRDLWPEVPIQMGAIRNLFLIWLSRKFEKTIYKNAEHVIALSPGMLDGVTKYIPKDRTSMIPNMAKKDEFWPRERNEKLVKKLGLNPKSFKVIHFGSLGLANGAITIIESAKLLKNDDTVEFLFVGGGATEGLLQDECLNSGLNNVKFLGLFSMKDTSEIVNLSDVSIISFKDLPILYTNSPNKLFDSFSAGKPIIVNSAGWTKEMVELHNCGFYANPNYPHELVEKIKYLQSYPVKAKSMGDNARKLAEEVYDKSILSRRFISVIESIYISN